MKCINNLKTVLLGEESHTRQVTTDGTPLISSSTTIIELGRGLYKAVVDDTNEVIALGSFADVVERVRHADRYKPIYKKSRRGLKRKPLTKSELNGSPTADLTLIVHAQIISRQLEAIGIRRKHGNKTVETKVYRPHETVQVQAYIADVLSHHEKVAVYTLTTSCDRIGIFDKDDYTASVTQREERSLRQQVLEQAKEYRAERLKEETENEEEQA